MWECLEFMKHSLSLGLTIYPVFSTCEYHNLSLGINLCQNPERVGLWGYDIRSTPRSRPRVLTQRNHLENPSPARCFLLSCQEYSTFRQCHEAQAVNLLAARTARKAARRKVRKERRGAQVKQVAALIVSPCVLNVRSGLR